MTLRVKNWDSRNRCEKHHHHPSDDHFQCGSLPVLVNHKPQWLQRIATGILMTVVEAKMQFPQLTSLNGPAQNEPSKPLYAPTYLPLHNIPVQTICFRELTITILIISTKTLPMMMIIIITALDQTLININRRKGELFTSADTKKPSPQVIVFTANETGKNNSSWKLENAQLVAGKSSSPKVGQINQSCNQSCNPHPSPPPPPALLGLSAAGDGSHGKMAKSE